MFEIHPLLAGRDFAVGNLGAEQMANFIYLVAERRSAQCVLVDPAWDVEGLIERVQREGLHLVGAIATHCHWDHVGGRFADLQIEGVGRLVERTRVPIYVHELDAERLQANARVAQDSIRRVKDGGALSLGAGSLSFLHTPGHTPGSHCIRAGDGIITGDTLFVGECGRVDLAGSDPDAMFASLKRLASLPEATRVYPGHHYGKTETSTIGEEKRTSPALRPADLKAWRAWLAAP
jgi:hydroxyacylglutathione hydrolase